MAKKTLENLENIDIKAFQHDLISWYEREQRQLPWREDQDPYKVWVSEIMLQQTRVDTVIPYFNRFVSQFPTMDALAEAEEEKVLKAWEGLGYYSRVRNLQAAVKEVIETYEGRVPNTRDGITKLKGVGPYTAGAILSIAYGIPEPAVDGNVMRVLSRILSVWEDISKPSSRKIFEEAVEKLISHENPSYFNQALMELGAIVCTPASPSCLLCPVREHCHAFDEGVQQQLPVKAKKKKQKHVQLAAAVVTDPQGRFLIHKRPGQGLLANLWEFPNLEIHLTIKNEKEQLKTFFANQYLVRAEPEKIIGQIEHIFSHLIWNINVYSGTIVSKVEETEVLKLAALEELEQYAFPVSHQKMLKLFLKNNP